jgi:hypothetical protein
MTILEQTDWCPTCGQRTAPYLWAGVGPDEIRAIQDAIAHWDDPEPYAKRVEVERPRMSTRDVSAFKPCGHAYRWKDCWIQSFAAGHGGDLDAEVCAICLPDEIRRGEVVVVNPGELARVLLEIESGPTSDEEWRRLIESEEAGA